MPSSTLTPVFMGLRWGLHALFAALVVLVVGRALVNSAPHRVPIVLLSLALVVAYGLGVALARHVRPHRRELASRLWLLILTGLWFGLLWLAPDAAYLVFPLFFLMLHLLPRWSGIGGVVTTAVMAVVALGLHNGWSIGGVVGPLVGAAVALLVGLGYQSLARDALDREALVSELLATERMLAASQHESGVLAERSRLAREIHDTVAQGLSSIHMLLHAAERSDPDGAGAEHVRLARDTAASTLAEARRFIRELTPAALDDEGLAGALHRLPRTGWIPEDLSVEVVVGDCRDLPMHVQTAVLRIAQGALANVVQHARARKVRIEVDHDEDSVHVEIIDDGQGFDVASIAETSVTRGSDSFGLSSTRERVEQLDGTMNIDSTPGSGTALSVTIPLHPVESA